MSPESAPESSPAPPPAEPAGVVVHRVDLPSLSRFAEQLVSGLRAVLGRDELVTLTLRDKVQTACPQCGLTLTADDLQALATPAGGDPADNSKLHRLRQGYCARNGCSGYFYQFTFQPGVDWSKVFGGAIGDSAAATSEAAIAAEHERLAAAAERQRRRLRILIGVGIVLLLLLLRQWFTGGTIPFLREPRQFHAAPASAPSSPAPSPASRGTNR